MRAGSTQRGAIGKFGYLSKPAPIDEDQNPAIFGAEHCEHYVELTTVFEAPEYVRSGAPDESAGQPGLQSPRLVDNLELLATFQRPE